MASCAGVILAGGISRRMGEDKARMEIGGQTLLEWAIAQLEGLEERFLSVDRPGRYRDAGIPLLADRYPGKGPIGGIATALETCRSPFVLAISCDMPLYRRELGEYLIARAAPNISAAVAVDRGGRPHPLCAVYAKRALPVLHRQMGRGNFRLTDALEEMGWSPVKLAEAGFPDEMLLNVNTPGDLALARALAATPQMGKPGVSGNDF